MATHVDDQGRPTTCSGGGPVVAIPAETAAAWRGTEPPVGAVVPDGWSWGSSGGPVCDYDRVCDVPYTSTAGYGGYGWLDVGGRPALALDGELVTVFLAEPEGGTLIRAATDGPEADPATIPDEAWTDATEMTLLDGRLFLFDSAYPGSADPEEIDADDGVAVAALGAGRWVVTFASTGAGTDFVRFRRP